MSAQAEGDRVVGFRHFSAEHVDPKPIFPLRFLNLVPDLSAGGLLLNPGLLLHQLLE